jgi:hypothetical protein
VQVRMFLVGNERDIDQKLSVKNADVDLNTQKYFECFM